MGAVCADNFETGTLSAICGGTTTILSFAKQQREETNRSLIDVIDEYHGEARGNSYCDYGFHLIITCTFLAHTMITYSSGFTTSGRRTPKAI